MAWRCHGTSNTNLVEQLKNAKILHSSTVESAMLKTDRKLYSGKYGAAYEDRPQYIGFDATISAPHMHAMALEVLKDCLTPGSSVLDVGCGSGYMTVAMAHMINAFGENDLETEQGTIVGIDYLPGLIDLARANVKSDNEKYMQVSDRFDIKLSDGWKGWPENAPFNAIHVGAAAESLPEELLNQLAPGGKMVIPVGKEFQELKVIKKNKDSSVSMESLCGVAFVPLVHPKS